MVPIRFARAGVVYASLNFEGLFSCSVEAEDPDGIDDCCSMMLSCAFSLCACGRRKCESELLRALFMSSGSQGSDGIDDVG